jgi:hypothetical protein
MVRDLHADDILSRFLFYAGHINKVEGVIKSCALAEKHPNGFSVYRTTNLCEGRVWGLGKNYVEISYLRQNPPRPMLGRFDVSVRFYHEGQLTIEHFPDPNPRHYNIHGMPISTEFAQEGQKLNLRQKVLQGAKLFLIP